MKVISASELAVKTRVIIFGCNNVGKTLAKLASIGGFDVTIADQRSEVLADLQSFGIDTICDKYENAVKLTNINKDSFVVVATPGHEFDKETVEWVLPYKPQYIGVMGSSSKVESFKNYWKEKGGNHEQVENIFMPIGLKLGSKTHEEIAIEILAQIVSVKNEAQRIYLNCPSKN